MVPAADDEYGVSLLAVQCWLYIRVIFEGAHSVDMSALYTETSSSGRDPEASKIHLN